GWTSGPALYYLTGVSAYGRVPAPHSVPARRASDLRTFSHGVSGWTVGAGIETQLVGSWTTKLEYLYVDLGHVNDFFAYAPIPTTGFAETSVVRNHVARLGVNYHFDRPVMARY